MFRSTSSVLALLVAMTMPAVAADYGDWEEEDGGPDFRTTYPIEPGDWAGLGDDDDPLSLEFGVRYWYSMGSQNFNSGGSSVGSSDTSHIGELHLRVEDHSTNTYAAAIAGYSIAVTGSVTTPTGTSSIVDGRIGYAGADLGWQALGHNNGSGLGPMVGYLYWKDAPDTGRFNYSTLNTGSTVTYDTTTGQTFIPGASAPNEIDAHALRLGVSGKAELSEMFDVTATVAAVPYAKVMGTAGVDDPTFSTAIYGGATQDPYGGNLGNISSIRSSPTTIDGWGYGAMVEGFVGIKPMENLAIRLGGRLWYLQGTADATYDRVVITDPADSADVSADYDVAPTVVEQSFISTNNPFRMLRYGLLAELTYAF